MSNHSSQLKHKQLKSAISKEYYQPPDEKQFIAFSLVLKQSNIVFGSHERLLLLDSKTKTLRYYKDIPEELPHINKQLPEGKEIIHIRKTRQFSFKSARNNIGKVKVQWLDLNGKKTIWNLTFASNQMMSQWVIMVNQVVKDGHLHPQNRPKSSTRRESKVQASKFMTQFMKQTTRNDENSGSKSKSRQGSLNKMPFWAKNLQAEKQHEYQSQEFTNKNDAEWLLSKVAEKQRQINQNLRKRQQQEQLEKAQKEQQEKQLQKQKEIEEAKLQEQKRNQVKKKTLEEEFLSRNSIHRTKKVEIQHMKEKEVPISREEMFRNKLNKKALERSKISSGDSESRFHRKEYINEMEDSSRLKQSKESKENENKQSKNYKKKLQIQIRDIEDETIPDIPHTPHNQQSTPYIKHTKSQIESPNPKISFLKKPQQQFKSAIQRTIQQQKSPKQTFQTPRNIIPAVNQKQEERYFQKNKENDVFRLSQHKNKSQDTSQRTQSNPYNFRYSTPQNQAWQSPRNRQQSITLLEQQKFRERVKSVFVNDGYDAPINTPSHPRRQTHYKNQYADHPYIQTSYCHSGISNSSTNYEKFMNKSLEISCALIDRLHLIVSEAQKNPSKRLFLQEVGEKNKDGKYQEYVLNVEKECIEYRTQLLVSGDLISMSGQVMENWYGGAFKMQQYSSIVKYINQLLKRNKKKLQKYSNSCIILPYSVVTYKWNLIHCKSTIPQNFLQASQQQIQQLDAELQVPAGTFHYYIMKQQRLADRKILLIDFAVNTLKIETDFPEKDIEDFVQKMENQILVCSSIADLCEQLSFTYSSTLNQQILCEILKKLNHKTYLQNSQKQSNKFSINLLYSIIYGLKSSEYIQKVLSKHMLDMESGQLYENIDELIKLALVRDIDQYSNHVSMAIMQKYRQYLEINRIRMPQNYEIIDNITLSTILHILGLQITYRSSDKNSPQKEMPLMAKNEYGEHLHSHGSRYILEFVGRVQGVGVQCFVKQLGEVKKILLEVSTVESEENKYTRYLELEQLLNKHCQEQEKKQPKNLKNQHTPSPNLNLTTRIHLFKSIYTPTMTINLPNQSNQDHFSSIIWLQPPTRFSFLLGINCTKWAIKNGHFKSNVIMEIIREQIKICQLWVGSYNYYLMLYYELIALYCSSLFDYDNAIFYTKMNLELVHRNYGETSANSIQKWYQLANIQLQAENYDEALIAYDNSLNLLLKKSTLFSSGIQSSSASLFSQNTQNFYATKTAELQLRNKTSEIHLAIGNISNSLQQSLICLKLYQDLVQQANIIELSKQLQILFRITRCYQINRQTNKLLQIIAIIGLKFPCNIIQSSHEEQLKEQQKLQEGILKSCLYGFVNKGMELDRNRRDHFRELIKKIKGKYFNRYTKQQYHNYITKWLNNYHIPHTTKTTKRTFTYQYSNQRINIFQKIQQQITTLPIYQSHKNTPEILNYSLYNDKATDSMLYSFSPKNASQQSNPKSLQTYRILEAIGHIVGFTYLKNCF